jgi:cytochrome c biogenesis protein CcmG, thiol:disulfide interchange protein DsbE
MKLKYWLPLAVFAGLAVFLGAGLKLKPSEVPSPFIGKPAPAFTLPVLADPSRQVSAAELKGQVWLLNVWASWCVACRDEHPLLVELAKTYPVPIYGLNYKDEPGAAKEWLLKMGDPYKASLMDSKGAVGLDYGVYGVPETFVIDAQGIVRFKHIGPVTPDVWRNKLEPLLKQLRG